MGMEIKSWQESQSLRPRYRTSFPPPRSERSVHIRGKGQAHVLKVERNKEIYPDKIYLDSRIQLLAIFIPSKRSVSGWKEVKIGDDSLEGIKETNFPQRRKRAWVSMLDKLIRYSPF